MNLRKQKYEKNVLDNLSELSGSISSLIDFNSELESKRFSLRQRDLYVWQRMNFGSPCLSDLALGMSEEVGELCHEILKDRQGIRENKNFKKDVADAVADTLIYGLQILSALKLDAEKEISEVIEKVLKRDWVKYPDTGLPPTGKEDMAGVEDIIKDNIPF